MAASAARFTHKLYVGNLPWTISHRELKKYFSEFGHVDTANVVFNKETGMSRGYGFVTFSTQGGLDSAINRQSHQLEGNVLTVVSSVNN